MNRNGTKKTIGLTPARSHVLVAIVDHVRIHDWPPTVRELCAACGITNNAMAETLDRLQRDGLIERERMLSRALRVTALGKRLLDLNREIARLRGLHVEQSRAALGDLRAAVETLRAEIAPTSPENFALMAEGYLADIAVIEAELRAAGVTP